MTEPAPVYKVNAPLSPIECPIERLIDVAVLMAQELQEYVDIGIECSGSNEAELATQELLKDWEDAYAACGLTDGDHFLEARTAAARIGCCTPAPESTPGWHYPKDNDDLANMPAPGEIVVLFYEGEDGNPVGPVICTPIHAEGLHIANGKNIYRRCIRWQAIPEEDSDAATLPGRIDAAQAFLDGL